MHCLVNLHDGRIMILGSYIQTPLDYTKDVKIFDPSNESFQTEPSLIYPRRDSACALIYSDLHDKRPVVLAAGGYYQATGS